MNKDKTSLEQLYSQLSSLHNLIVTISMGLEAEKIEKQAIDCLECIDKCVLSIRQSLELNQQP